MGKKWEKTKEFCKEHATGLALGAGSVILGGITIGLWSDMDKKQKQIESLVQTLEELAVTYDEHSQVS